MKATNPPSKGDLVTTKLRIEPGIRLAIMGLVVGETGTRVYIKLLKHSFNPSDSWQTCSPAPPDAFDAVLRWHDRLTQQQNIIQVERAECKIVNSTSSA